MLQRFEFLETKLKGLKEINVFFTDDNRGYLTKDFEKDIYLESGVTMDLQECFYTKSFKGVIRANHFQVIKPQKKLIRVVYGEVYDVVADLREGSETFGQWQGFYLSEENRKALFIPEGFSHGYLVLSDFSIVSYKCEGKFYGEYDSGITWNDSDLGIDWPIEKVNNIIISEKDKNLLSLKEFKEQYGSII